ncbi:MAG: hypothetical protein JNN12_08430 [Bacteroidetes Order II. Incertae sedis bacterium]|nr:hypothetical protein [Bacteroidetes Order II. bacterium]
MGIGNNLHGENPSVEMPSFSGGNARSGKSYELPGVQIDSSGMPTRELHPERGNIQNPVVNININPQNTDSHDGWQQYLPTAPEPKIEEESKPVSDAGIESIRVFFGYLLLMFGTFLTIIQSFIFLLGKESGFGFGSLFGLTLITAAAVLAAVWLMPLPNTLGRSIVTTTTLSIAISLMMLMAGSALVQNETHILTGGESLVLSVYLVCFSIYGLWGLGVLDR